MTNHPETVTRLTPEELNALLANYEAEARRMRGETLKVLFSEWLAGARQAIGNIVPQPRNVAHASE
ncbi:MAG: hypothetical protein AAF441_07095 [Pseudomonadota bacterium]